ncbi:MAG: hypothetical protein R2713_21750 [Ilumatobacteraceae bacterium]
MSMSHDDRDLARANDTNAASGGNGISPSLIGFVIVAVLSIIFFFQNGDRTDIDLWIFDWNTTVRWSIVVSIFLGVVLDRLFGIWCRRGKKKDAAKKDR